VAAHTQEEADWPAPVAIVGSSVVPAADKLYMGAAVLAANTTQAAAAAVAELAIL